jgi:hypothetical protein
MAESARAKANRYARGEFTNAELKILLGGLLVDQAIDVATFGRLSKLKGKALSRVVLPLLRKTGFAAARAAPTAVGRLAGTAVGATRFVAMRHPYIAAAVVTYEVVKNREQIAQLLREGWEVIDPVARGAYEIAEAAGVYDTPPGISSPFREKFGTKMPRRRTSKFNRAISAGMKAVKRSKFLGKPGKFTNSKKAFATVTRTVSRLRKGAKVSSKGALGTIKRAVKRYI